MLVHSNSYIVQLQSSSTFTHRAQPLLSPSHSPRITKSSSRTSTLRRVERTCKGALAIRRHYIAHPKSMCFQNVTSGLATKICNYKVRTTAVLACSCHKVLLRTTTLQALLPYKRHEINKLSMLVHSSGYIVQHQSSGTLAHRAQPLLSPSQLYVLP